VFTRPPACSLRAPATVRPGRPVRVTIRCKQSADVRIAGTVVRVLGPRAGGKSLRRRLPLRRVTVSAPAHAPRVVTLRLPAPAFANPGAHPRGSLQLTLSASSAGGTTVLHRRIPLRFGGRR
jgi:hypothetical protein